MSVIKDAAEALMASLEAVEGLLVQRDFAASSNPPAAVVGPPRIAWEGLCGPTSATFEVFLVVAADAYALDRLWALVLDATAAIDETPDAVVTEASPGTYPAGGTDLPAYSITVEVAL